MFLNRKALKHIRDYQRNKENDVLPKGTAFYLIEALLNLNKLSDQRLVEVIVMSRNSPETEKLCTLHKGIN